MHVSPLLSTCAQLDSDPLGCTTCEETEEDHDAVNMTVSENPEPNDLVNIEDVSRKTTIGEILNIVSRRIHYLGFPKMDLNMGLLQPISQWPGPRQLHPLTCAAWHGSKTCSHALQTARSWPRALHWSPREH